MASRSPSPVTSLTTPMGANAVVMMRFDSSELGQTMTEVVAYGTAAIIEPVSQ